MAASKLEGKIGRVKCRGYKESYRLDPKTIIGQVKQHFVPGQSSNYISTVLRRQHTCGISSRLWHHIKSTLRGYDTIVWGGQQVSRRFLTSGAWIQPKPYYDTRTWVAQINKGKARDVLELKYIYYPNDPQQVTVTGIWLADNLFTVITCQLASDEQVSMALLSML